jgi:phosphatidate cytidylyltransferase
MLPIFATFIVGGVVAQITTLLLSLFAMNEFHNSFKIKGINIPRFLGCALCVLIFVKNLFPEFNLWLNILTIAFVFISALLMIFKKSTPTDLALMILSSLYSSFAFCKIANIYNYDKGVLLVAIIFLISFSSDTCAYLVGRKFGKHKLIPSVSPNKTIEGSVGGIIGSALLTTVFCYFANLNVFIFLPIAIVGSIVSQIGDLFASSIKRYCGIKDFGKLFPGHGGVLDRFDSAIFVSILISAIPVSMLIK